MKQEELDLFESRILDMLFGGHNRENLIIRVGMFKYDLSDKVNKIIQDFEDKVKPLITEDGYINTSDLNLPMGIVKLSELASSLKPLVTSIKGIIAN